MWMQNGFAASRVLGKHVGASLIRCADASPRQADGWGAYPPGGEPRLLGGDDSHHQAAIQLDRAVFFGA